MSSPHWDLNGYFTNQQKGLVSALVLSEYETKKLKSLRTIVRRRIRHVFEEAGEIIKNPQRYDRSSSMYFSEESRLNAIFSETHFQYIDVETKQKVADLVNRLSDDERTAFLGLTPRFATQGSFNYGTLNRPYKTPPQEMDIDDGTYLPADVFKDKGDAAHSLLLLLVDCALLSLCNENAGWIYEAKRTCARIKIPNENTHIDVPMYAIPWEQFSNPSRLEKARLEYSEANESWALDTAMNAESPIDFRVPSDSVCLAIRSGDAAWQISDPRTVEDWFEQSCRDIGNHLKKACRIVKAWKDKQWPQGNGPSSILLMKVVVDILDKYPASPENFSEVMSVISKHLASELRKGVNSPDESDIKPLFPLFRDQDEKQKAIIAKAEEFKLYLDLSLTAASKEEALERLSYLFGNRVSDPELIIPKKASKTLNSNVIINNAPARITNTLTSG
jgi:hypothetical protein